MDFAENLKKYSKVRTVSIAFPASIFDNTPTPTLEAYLVGQVARAAVVFNVTEIIIFDEDSSPESKDRQARLVKMFEYAECPQYLRKRIFAIEPDLKFAGLIHPLESQHHLRASQLDCPYREGVTIKHTQKGDKDVTEVNIGLKQSVYVPGVHELGTRVTVQVDPGDLKKIQNNQPGLLLSSGQRYEALIVPPVEPLEKLNLYWGYYVRKADTLSQALKQNTFEPGRKNFYDLVIGTSERGVCIDELEFKRTKNESTNGDESGQPKKKVKPDFSHIMIVFGGVKGLEYSASCDHELKNCTNVSSLFDYYINTCPNQGSTTIRTEEAILITMSALRPKLNL